MSVLWYEAEMICNYFRKYLKNTRITYHHFEPVGDFRRCCEVVESLEIVIATPLCESVMNSLERSAPVERVLSRSETQLRLQLVQSLSKDQKFHDFKSKAEAPPFRGITVCFHVVQEKDFAYTLWKQTGSAAHWNAIEQRISKPPSTSRFSEEMDYFQDLGLPWIPPELREGRLEIDHALDHRLPVLVEEKQLRGDLHSHTNWTDGLYSIGEMVSEARIKGLDYLAITDHSHRVIQCNGLDEKRILQQWERIDRLNGELREEIRWKSNVRKFTVLKGVEVDILENAKLDLSDEILARADWVGASLHFGQEQSPAKITRRMIAAIENPHVCCIGHPTGRILLQYPPYEADWDEIFSAAVQYGCFLELNSHPKRLDLNDELCAKAKSMGIKIVINSDAHTLESLYLTRYGINQARRAGLTAGDVANTRTWTELRKISKKGTFFAENKSDKIP